MGKPGASQGAHTARLPCTRRTSGPRAPWGCVHRETGGAWVHRLRGGRSAGCASIASERREARLSVAGRAGQTGRGRIAGEPPRWKSYAPVVRGQGQASQCNEGRGAAEEKCAANRQYCGLSYSSEGAVVRGVGVCGCSGVVGMSCQHRTLMESRSRLAPPGVRSGSARGPFGVRSESVRGSFGVRSGSVRGPFGIRSRGVRGSVGLRSGSVRSLFGIRSGSVRDPFGVRSKSVRAPKRKTPIYYWSQSSARSR